GVGESQGARRRAVRTMPPRDQIERVHLDLSESFRVKGLTLNQSEPRRRILPLVTPRSSARNRSGGNLVREGRPSGVAKAWGQPPAAPSPRETPSFAPCSAARCARCLLGHRLPARPPRGGRST